MLCEPLRGTGAERSSIKSLPALGSTLSTEECKGERMYRSSELRCRDLLASVCVCPTLSQKPELDGGERSPFSLGTTQRHRPLILAVLREVELDAKILMV